MKTYELSDLHIETDGVATIRRAFGPTRTAAELTSFLVRDLVLMKALPVRLDFADGWWSVSSDVDWLVASGKLPLLRPFTHVVHFPDAGQNACRGEIFLTAFADAVVTQGEKGDPVWITGDSTNPALPETLERLLRDKPGRTVAFRMASNR
jgi:hypothetical protein